MAVRRGQAAAGSGSSADRIVRTYVDGNTVRRLEPAPREHERREVQKDIRIKRNREKAVRMNRAYLIMLTAMIVVTMGICFHYLRLQTSVSSTLRNINTLEEEYSALVEKNNAAELKLQSGVDLDYIYRVATEELGMVPAGQEQIRLYDRVESRYVRQNESIPEN